MKRQLDKILSVRCFLEQGYSNSSVNGFGGGDVVRI